MPLVRPEAQAVVWGWGKFKDRLPQNFNHREPNCLHSKQKISTRSVQSRGGAGITFGRGKQLVKCNTWKISRNLGSDVEVGKWCKWKKFKVSLDRAICIGVGM